MEQLSLSVELREGRGKGANRRIRREGKLPGVVYGLGHNVAVTVEPRQLQKLLLEEGGQNKVLNLKGPQLDGRHAIVKEFMVDPVKRTLVHVDLLEIDISKKIQVTVLLNFIGKSVGVTEGGVLNIVERQIPVKCLPTSIPQHIDVDVTPLKIGASIHFDDLKLPEGVEKATHMNPTLVTVVPPAKEEELAPSLTPAAEPEVITEKKKEGEGEAAAAGGAEAKKEEKKK